MNYDILNYGTIEVGLFCLCQLTLRTKLWSDWLQRLSLHRRQSPASKLWMKLSLSFVSYVASVDIECQNLFRSSIQSLTVTFASSSPVRSKNVSLRVPFSSLKQFLSRTWKWVLHTCQVKGGSSWSGVTCAWPRAARARRGTSTIIICVPLGPLCPTVSHCVPMCPTWTTVSHWLPPRLPPGGASTPPRPAERDPPLDDGNLATCYLLYDGCNHPLLLDDPGQLDNWCWCSFGQDHT